MFRSVDLDAMCNIIAKNALEVAMKTGLDLARNKIQNTCVEIIRAYRNSGAYGANAPQGYQVQLPENLQLLPLYTVSISVLQDVLSHVWLLASFDEKCCLPWRNGYWLG